MSNDIFRVCKICNIYLFALSVKLNLNIILTFDFFEHFTTSVIIHKKKKKKYIINTMFHLFCCVICNSSEFFFKFYFLGDNSLIISEIGDTLVLKAINFIS